MRTRQLGTSDLMVSRLGLGAATWGTYTTPEDDAAEQLRIFVSAGGNLIDTADVYGRSEEIIGRLLGRVVARKDVIVATKAGAGPLGAHGHPTADASRAHLLAMLDQSLRRLRLDYVDLWQLHAWDDNTALEETASALDTALDSGRARYAGVSNYAGWQTAAAAMAFPAVSAQVEYSLLQRGVEREVVPAAQHFRIGILAWAPLGRGVLTGKYVDGVPTDRQKSRFFQSYIAARLRSNKAPRVVDAVLSAADKLGCPPAAVAVAWARDRPGIVAPLIGARSAEQLRGSLTAEDVTLPEDIVAELNEVSEPYLGYPEAQYRRTIDRHKPRTFEEAQPDGDGARRLASAAAPAPEHS